MLTLQTSAEISEKISELKKNAQTIGFVPTMGYLHAGHISLVGAAREQCDCVVVSIFVNPKQFGPQEDFAKYPRDLERDKTLLLAAGADILFAPDTAEIYPPDNSVRQLQADKSLTNIACGVSRPGHFDGVATVVARLFELVEPDKAFFGQKDYQQLRVIQAMVAAEKFTVQIISCPIMREADGLAMSSRNKYLTQEQKKNAAAIFRGLTAAAQNLRSGKNLSDVQAELEKSLSSIPEAKIDYIEILERKNLARVSEYIPGGTVILAAVYLGGTRLIDNIEV